jgi:hypothetical protein
MSYHLAVSVPVSQPNFGAYEITLLSASVSPTIFVRRLVTSPFSFYVCVFLYLPCHIKGKQAISSSQNFWFKTQATDMLVTETCKALQKIATFLEFRMVMSQLKYDFR